jgi:hypothetical protein
MMKDDPIRDAQAAIARAIADLKAANIAVPMSLHRAAHALSYAVASRPEDMPACNGQGHAGALWPGKNASGWPLSVSIKRAIESNIKAEIKPGRPKKGKMSQLGSISGKRAPQARDKVAAFTSKKRTSLEKAEAIVAAAEAFRGR